MEKINITIAGAGVIGLAVGLELSRNYKDIYILEQENTFGSGTSSRNSEVIHAGIYYPKDSLKAITCVEGNRLLYEFCSKNNIAHKRIGKLIVARENEVSDLEALFENGRQNGVEDLTMISEAKIKELEPQVRATAAIFSPATGIVDSHSLMKSIAWHFKEQGGILAYNTSVTGIQRCQDGYKITAEEAREGTLEFHSNIFINCAGLNSDKVATLAGISKDEYRLKYCKGVYMRVSPAKSKLLSRLVYPVPKKTGAGLGIHATPDLAGSLRLGPDEEYIDGIDYSVDPGKTAFFYENVKNFLPFLCLEDISCDTAGIRPKLQGKQEAFRDFVIQEEGAIGLPGFINLIGIESPGLTGALSIARLVNRIVSRFS